MRRSQIEIVGLLIIVIMISFMILFYVAWTLQPPEDIVGKYMESTKSSRFVGALLKTDSTCTEDMSMRDLIIDCAKSPETGGSIETKCIPDGERPCDYMKEVLDELLTNSFETVEEGYQFMILSPKNVMIYSRNCSSLNGCPLKKTGSGDSHNQPLPVGYQGTMQIRMCLPVCG
jgi:hypothetical protein